MNELQAYTAPAGAALTQATAWGPDQVDLIKRTICKGGSDDDLLLFMAVCQRTGLDPFSKQIYAVFRKDYKTGRETMCIQTGIDGYRQIADRQGNYAGSDDPLYNLGHSEYQMRSAGESVLTATVTVWKLVGGVRCPFTATAGWDSYCPKPPSDKMWIQFPFLMLAKCAEALALRKGWAAQISGVYTDAEMQQAGYSGEIPNDYAAGPMREIPVSGGPKFTPKQQAEIDATRAAIAARGTPTPDDVLPPLTARDAEEVAAHTLATEYESDSREPTAQEVAEIFGAPLNLDEPPAVEWTPSATIKLINRECNFRLFGQGKRSDKNICWDAAIPVKGGERAIKLLYCSPANAEERSGLKAPERYIGSITATISEALTTPGMFRITGLRFGVGNG